MDIVSRQRILRGMCVQGGVVVIFTLHQERRKVEMYIVVKKHEILVTLKRLWFSLDGQSIAFTRFLFRSLGGHAPSHAHCKSVCVVGLD